MTISRMQEPRQLYGLGSFVKKITKPIKKIVKSPIGKAALGAAALYGVNRFGIPGTGGFGQGAISRLFSGRVGNPAMQKAIGSGGGLGGLIKRIAGGAAKGFGNLSGGQQAFLLGGAGLSLLPFLTGGAEEEEDIVEDTFDVTPSSIANIRQMARNRDPSLAFLPQQQFVRPGFYAAEGGTPREMFAGGANRVTQLMQLLETTKDPMDRLMIQQEIDMILGKSPFNAAKGGIAELPQVRMLEGGVPEVDYRQSGGFVPMGKKEKADDVPAMLSKNEFVMTADAVRGMGDGNVEKGAQKMYDQMKQLENRVV